MPNNPTYTEPRISRKRLLEIVREAIGKGHNAWVESASTVPLRSEHLQGPVEHGIRTELNLGPEPVVVTVYDEERE